MNWKTWCGAASAACVLVLGATGCDSGSDTSSAAVALPCPTTDGGAVTLVVGARANSPKPDLPAEIQGLVRAAALKSQKVQVIRIDGEPSVALTAVFANNEKNDAKRTADLTKFVGQTRNVVQNLQPKTAEADDLAAITEAAHITPANGTVVLVDSGLSTAGALNFRDTDMFGVAPTDVTSYLESQHLMPKLDGLSVVLVGLGNTAEPQPSLNESLSSTVTKLWHTVAEKAGASCVYDMPAPPQRTAATTSVKVSLVSLPKAPVFAPCGTTVLADSDSVGFIVDQAVMRSPDAGKKTLQQLADQLLHGSQRVKLIGNTSSDGPSEAHNVDLSNRRAQAIKDVLVQLGVAANRITTEGDGSTGKYHVVDRAANGVLIPSVAAHNRSVVVELICQQP